MGGGEEEEAEEEKEAREEAEEERGEESSHNYGSLDEGYEEGERLRAQMKGRALPSLWDGRGDFLSEMLET